MKTIFTILSIWIMFPLSAKIDEANLSKNGIITGLIIDNNTNEPIPYATIIIKNTELKNISGGISDDRGKFEIKQIPEGRYTLEVQFIGYKTFSKAIDITSKAYKIDLGTIALEEDAQNLSEVEVRAETSSIVQKIDRKVINIGKDLTSAGASAAEIMNNIQSVSVDRDGNISLRGNTNVRILVDGKPTNISASQLLQQIPSTSIKSIELITNPSAKYNPEGMSGIINIVLNKNANLGFNGNINAGLTYGENARFNGSLDLNYRSGKFNFFANYGYNTGKRDNYGEVNRTDNNSLQEFEFDSDNTSHLLKTGLDFEINEKNTFSFYTVQNTYDSKSNGSTIVTYRNGDFNNIHQVNESKNDSKTETYNFNYKIDFNKEGHNLEFEANFSNTDAPEKAQFNELINPSNPVLNYTDDLENDRNNRTFNLDYVNPLSDKSKLELGLESRTRDMDNNRMTTQHQIIYDDNGAVIGTEPIDDAFYQYDRDINSAYATYSHEFEKMTFQLGARIENYQVKAIFNDVQIFEDDYTTVYPSAFLTYNASEKNQYQLSYSRRVDRPGFQQVNPIREWSTPQITSVGNPALNPQFTNSIEFNYTRKLKNGSITMGTFYRIINDNITRVLYADPLDENKVILSYGNTDNNHAYGLEISGNYKFTDWWNMNSSFDLYHQTEKGLIGLEAIEVDNTTWNFRMNNNFEIVKNLRLQWFTMYRGANKNLQFDVEPMWKMDLGARLNIFDGKGTISARYSDIFNTMFFQFDSENPYPSNGEFHWESQTAYLGFSYRFGSGKNKKRSRKNRKNGDKQGGGFI
ncbi:MAG: TonB-dependent receptor [Flavobacteriaceae bacterium]|nr:TonB-dependent receptor [Flavobacteriaceae bacterium]